MARFTICALFLWTLIIYGVLPARACDAVGEMFGHVRIVDESAVIVWDAARQTQHFIRRATFDAQGRSVGFIVPTPTVPQLAAADDSVFRILANAIEPEVIVKEHVSYYFAWGALEKPKGQWPPVGEAAADNAADEVEVVSTQRVGDYDATILRATDNAALNRWLKEHGYNSDAASEKWLQAYVDKGWIVTAFKIAKENAAQPTFSSGLVRMSFKTPRPFFPYREPQRNKTKNDEKQRSLRIFFFAPQRMQAAPGNFGAAQAWPGQIKWADDMSQHGYAEKDRWKWIAEDLQLPAATLQTAHWMTVFEDDSTPRPGTDDVFFTAAPNRSTLPAPIVVDKPVKKPIYYEWIILAVIAAGGTAVYIARRK